MSTVVPHPQVLRTKLGPPPRREGMVARPGLVARLDGDALTRLRVVSAPAGWGKTTLLAQWAAATGLPLAWVGLDAGDSDPVRFWAHVVAALHGAGVARAAPANLGAAGESGLGDLVNALAEDDAPVALVLDDYHLIQGAEVPAGMAFLASHLPGNVRLAIGTRADPPLDLPLRRARGELVEVRAADLRFDVPAAAALVDDAAPGALGADAVQALHRRTEGWAAGLYLAALSLRGREDPSAFVAAFAGDDRLVVDYLAAEVLAGQPEDRRHFLLHTSILPRLSAPLCDAVTGREDSQRLLAELEASNLFLVPLDSRRGWYRYHHLFGELLRHELAIESGVDPAELHRRAANWCRTAGDDDAAVRHLVAAGDENDAADLIADAWPAFHRESWIGTVEGWLDLLRPAAVRADPRLCLARAWAAVNIGSPEQVGDWVAAAAAVMPAGASRELRASLAMARGFERLFAGDTPAALTHAAEGAELEPDPGSPWRAVALLARGLAEYESDLPDAAHATLADAVAVGERAGNPIPVLVALGHLADLDLARGDVVAARAGAEHGLRHAATEHHDRFPHAAAAHWAMASVLLAEGDPGGALGHADTAVALARRGRFGKEIASAFVVRAEVHLIRGEADAAARDLADAEAVLEGVPGGAACMAARRIAGLREAGGPDGTGAPVDAPGPAAGEEPLSARERVVLGMLAGPASLREIAAELVVSPNTVKTQVRAIYRKLGVSDRAGAVAAARRRPPPGP
ncbi:MAG: LuxR C-terminal-related transcriptional regulator [Miltoncostaeaceae bacterium]